MSVAQACQAATLSLAARWLVVVLIYSRTHNCPLACAAGGLGKAIVPLLRGNTAGQQCGTWLSCLFLAAGLLLPAFFILAQHAAAVFAPLRFLSARSLACCHFKHHAHFHDVLLTSIHSDC